MIVGNDGDKAGKKPGRSCPNLDSGIDSSRSLRSVGTDKNRRHRQRPQPHIEYLVNAAGHFNPTAFVDHTEDDYDSYMGLNKAIFLSPRRSPRNEANGGGSIVNIGSMWAKQAIKATPTSAYSMAKAGHACSYPAHGNGTG